MKMHIGGFPPNPEQTILLKQTLFYGKVNEGTGFRTGFAHSFSYAKAWRFVQPHLAFCQWTQ